HGVQTFVPAMIAQGKPGIVINTGSKHGIVSPPGRTAYNISKAGVKVLTEALAHELRETPGCRITAHLLIPGLVHTGITAVRPPEQMAAAWTAEEVVDFMMAAVARGDFYILCPDRAVTRAMDEKRIRWAADDIIKNRPALSRWHEAFRDEFAAWEAEGG